MPYTDRELLARLICCEAGGEGDDGMRAVASVVINRAHAQDGEFARVSNGGNVRNIIRQPRQFTCMIDSLGGKYNPQNIYNMNPEEIHYAIADWALAGNTAASVGNCLFFQNPYRPVCPQFFPPGGIGTYYTRINHHCFYAPTEKYRKT